jgi:hypothetical protein
MYTYIHVRVYMYIQYIYCIHVLRIRILALIKLTPSQKCLVFVKAVNSIALFFNFWLMNIEYTF